MSRTRSGALLLAGAIVGAALTAAFFRPETASPLRNASAFEGPRERAFEMSITATDIDAGGGSVWHAWTFNGTVPGPTLTANVGDVLRVTVHNRHDIVHSFHTHLTPLGIESDGSQLNTITGLGAMAMIPPGGSYTYSFTAGVAGVFYYHCHSADGGHSISQHIAQGLYGAILIKDPQEIPVRDEVVFMGERGFDTEGAPAYWIMNGMGMKGGEHALMELHHEKGMDGVASVLGTQLPVIAAKVDEPVRLNVINIGDAVHSFHLHGMTAYTVDHDGNQPLPAQVLGLVPGEADRILVTPQQPGIWLFHCHVVSHADGGMIGVLTVEA